MKIKKYMLNIIVICLLLFVYSCDEKPEDPIDPIDPPNPPIVEKTPLELAFESFGDVSAYTMSVVFESPTNTYPVTIKIDDQQARVDALGETTYYEVAGTLCYIYEFKATSWTKSPTSCSTKTSQELAFITDFDVDYFDEIEMNRYELKDDYYSLLDGFLGSTSTTNFLLILQDDLIHQISFTMIRNSYEFDITITLSNFDQTTVIFPQVS